MHGLFTTSDLSMSDVCTRKLFTSLHIGEAALHVIPRDKELNTFSYHYTYKKEVLKLPNTLIVGIDIRSQSNSIFFVDDAGNHLIKKPFSLPNHQEGANELIKRVIDCLNQYNLSYVKFGMEATSHYAWHLHLYLASSYKLLPYKLTFYVLNPSIVKGFKKIYTFLPKTDNIDANYNC